ncbi:MAG: PadR family transcriptional regulator [Mariniblastus sp.]
MAKTGTTKFAILGILLSGPQSGYEIAKFCREVLSSFWSESYGQIYPKLKELVDEGLVKKKDVAESKRKKSVYTITAKGKKAVAAWAAEPAATQPVRNELLLKVFFGSELAPEISRQQLQHALIRQQHALRNLKSIEQGILDSEEDITERQKRHACITVRLGIHIMQARIKWAKESLASLNAPYD